MDILKSSLIYKIISGFFVYCQNSKIGQGISRVYKNSLFNKIFFEENNKIMEYTSHSRILKGHNRPYEFSVDHVVEGDIKSSPFSWLLSSFFVKMIITWKDCEFDDKYN